MQLELLSFWKSSTTLVRRFNGGDYIHDSRVDGSVVHASCGRSVVVSIRWGWSHDGWNSKFSSSVRCRGCDQVPKELLKWRVTAILSRSSAFVHIGCFVLPLMRKVFVWSSRRVRLAEFKFHIALECWSVCLQNQQSEASHRHREYHHDRFDHSCCFAKWTTRPSSEVQQLEHPTL